MSKKRTRLLLPLVLLTGCAVDTPREDATTEAGDSPARVVNLLELPLKPAAGGSEKTFSMGETRGSVAASGDWQVRTAVAHGQVRCATYEVGIQLGADPQGCIQPQWLAEPVYGTRQRQCNSATLIHNGGGNLPNTPPEFRRANCVRVVTRCSGAC